MYGIDSILSNFYDMRCFLWRRPPHSVIEVATWYFCEEAGKNVKAPTSLTLNNRGVLSQTIEGYTAEWFCLIRWSSYSVELQLRFVKGWTQGGDALTDDSLPIWFIDRGKVSWSQRVTDTREVRATLTRNSLLIQICLNFKNNSCSVVSCMTGSDSFFCLQCCFEITI